MTTSEITVNIIAWGGAIVGIGYVLARTLIPNLSRITEILTSPKSVRTSSLRKGWITRK